MHLARAGVVALLVLDGLGAAYGLARHGGSPPDRPAAEAPGAPSAAVAEAERFLARYVDADGRVVRHDEGGDTVSEGQAYALLLAVGVDDRARFDRVWAWTEDHLRRDDGLLSWRWADGAVADPQPAADADLDAAWALALAAERWPDGPYAADAGRLVAAVESHEVVPAGGARAIAAGPWAVGDPVVLNPSYASPVADHVLAEAGVGPDGAAEARRAGHLHLLERLVASGPPPDWAHLTPTGDLVGVAGPTGGGEGRFGWDAVRLPLRFAAACRDEERALAAAVWPAMEQGAGMAVMGDHPARLVGAAAAAAAAGATATAEELLAQASARHRAAPTYYGGALTALARLLLTTDRLGGCPPLEGA